MIKNGKDKGPAGLTDAPNKTNHHLNKADTALDAMTDDEKQAVLQNGNAKLLAIYSLCQPLRIKSMGDSKRTRGKKEMADMVLKVLEDWGKC